MVTISTEPIVLAHHGNYWATIRTTQLIDASEELLPPKNSKNFDVHSWWSTLSEITGKTKRFETIQIFFHLHPYILQRVIRDYFELYSNLNYLYFDLDDWGRVAQEDLQQFKVDNVAKNNKHMYQETSIEELLSYFFEREMNRDEILAYVCGKNECKYEGNKCKKVDEEK